MDTKIKFSSKLEKRLLDQLKNYSKTSKKNISVVLNEAVAEYLKRVRLRPAFIDASEEVIKENKELLKVLAK